MEEKTTLEVTLDEAREWYSSNNDTLKKIALQAFNKEKLAYNFKDITTFKKACEALGLNYDVISIVTKDIFTFSKASAAMFKLNIIRNAINLWKDLHLAKDPKDSCIYYPFNPLIAINTHAYDTELKSGTMEIVGSINVEGEVYSVLGGDCGGLNHCSGLGSFGFQTDICYSLADYAFLGCANKEIARHFSRYFGVLITEAKFGDLDGFKVVRDLYRCVK